MNKLNKPFLRGAISTFSPSKAESIEMQILPGLLGISEKGEIKP